MRWSSGAGEEVPLRAARGGGAMRGAAEKMAEGRPVRGGREGEGGRGLLPVRGGREGEEGLLRVVPGRGRRLSGGVILWRESWC